MGWIRAQDRAYLKYKLDTKIQLHFKESDYALDEELVSFNYHVKELDWC